MDPTDRGPASRPRRRSPQASVGGSKTPRFGHPPSARVRVRREFERVHREGVRVQAGRFLVLACPSTTGRARLGMAVGKKVGGAVVRNRIRRLIREVFRLTAPELTPVDVVVIARTDSAELAALGLAAMERELGPAFRRASERMASRPGGRR